MFEWFYGYEYRYFFRENTQMLGPEDFQKFQELSPSGLQRMTLLENQSQTPVGHMTFNLVKPLAAIYNFGILLDKDHRGKTFCIEGCVLMMELLFRRLGAHKMVCDVSAEDVHLNRIIELGGFTHEATFKDEIFFENRYFDENHYVIFKDRFEEYYGDFAEKGIMNNPNV